MRPITLLNYLSEMIARQDEALAEHTADDRDAVDCRPGLDNRSDQWPAVLSCGLLRLK